MRDLIGVFGSIAAPWLAGAWAVHALARRAACGWLLSVGYGYLAGALAVTIVLRALSAAGVPWSLPVVAVPVLALALLAYWLQRPGGFAGRCRIAWQEFGDLTRPVRLLFAACLALMVLRIAGLAVEALVRPLQPWDAWSHWGTKAKVWFHFRRMVPFVAGGEWLGRGDLMAFIDQQPRYPGTVPLLQVHTDLWLGGWNDALMNAPWPALLVSLALAFYAQARRIGANVAVAIVFTYVTVSLPFLDVHVALAGMADVFLAAAYALAAMALWRAMRTHDRVDVVLAAFMGLACAAIKTEGLLWLLTFAPALLVAANRRIGFGVVGIGAALALLYLLFGPPTLRLFGYALRTQPTDVWLPLSQHLFVMDNWHLFWYGAIVAAVWRWRRLLDPDLAPMTIMVLAGLAFITVVFFFSSAAGGVEDETLVNRLLLHLVPTLAFYVMLLLQPASVARTVNAPVEPANAERLPA